MSIALKAVIFDYGKVLCAPQQASDLEGMASLLNLTGPEFTPLYWRDRMTYDADQIDARSYWTKIAAWAQTTLTDERIETLRRLDVESWSKPDTVVARWAGQLREAGVRTAILSNMPMDLRRYVTTEADWLPGFDHMTFSCDLRVCKPDPAIYEHCLLGLGAAASETLFLDDRPENVEAAQREGIHSFVFTTPTAAADVLGEQFDLPVAIER